MTNPWLTPLMMSSANVIAMRTWMLWPAGGRLDDWQRRESKRMVDEKVAAVREAQLQAMSLAWQMCFAPWALWMPGSGQSPQQAMHAATDALVRPFSRRANANAARLGTRAARSAIEAWTAPAAAVMAAAGGPAARPARRRGR
jgi:hypothetical protein